MASVRLCHANVTPTKRSFEYTFHKDSYRTDSAVRNVVTTETTPLLSQTDCSSSPPKRRSVSFSRASSMLVNGTHRMSGSFPSFTSVFGSEDTAVASAYRDIALEDQPKLDQHAINFPPPSARILQNHIPQKLYPRRGSAHSLMSDSTNSSPTTTHSTFDSPLVSDSSPSSSPESASSLAPLTPFQTIMLSPHVRPATGLEADKKKQQQQDQEFPPNPAAPVVGQDSKKNVKNLTIDMNVPALRRPATANGTESFQPFSAPTSPLKEPLRSARRKPTNLTIRTPGFQSLNFARAANDVPPTPSQRPLLLAHQSSPLLSSLTSPVFAPAGGMHLPLQLGAISKESSISGHDYGSSYGTSSISGSLPDLREESIHHSQKSQETPERGYTEGPVRIYDSGVYLYLEPTAQEASNFDTVINVAKEIKNPFLETKSDDATVMSVWRNGHEQPKTNVPEPQTAVSEVSFKSAFEWPQLDKSITPTTPTQSSFVQKPKEPEYIHVKWDHNSEILDDLYPLCQIIDQRIQAGKKVLVHCQLGVSRSASLIIAYGLFKGYQPDFHTMYTAVKERSRWVGPNMSLIYQLMDFHSKTKKGDYISNSKPPNQEWFQNRIDGAKTPTAAPNNAEAATVTNEVNFGLNAAIEPPKRSPNARKITPLRLNKALPPVPLFSQDNKSPVTTSTSPRLQDNNLSKPEPPLPSPSSTTIKRAASKPLPLRERSLAMAIPEHRPRQQLAGLTLPRPSSIMDLAMNDVPETPSLFSPRATEFVASPFGIQVAGDLSVPGSRKSQHAPSTFDWLPLRWQKHVRTPSLDPRSPHQKDEPKNIFRTIDGFL